jgi:two-component system, LytTR family, sensor kinase
MGGKHRFKYMIVLALVINVIIGFSSDINPVKSNILFGFLSALLSTFLVWEGNVWIEKYMNKVLPWEDSPLKRILVHASVTIVYSALTIFFATLFSDRYLCDLPVTNKRAFFGLCIALGVIISITILSIESGYNFFKRWKASLLEVEKYKTESLQAHLQNLRNQINPHFLFNNMSVLSSLVYEDQDKAVDFINQLSKVYRYLLDSKDRELVRLEHELDFIASYTYLLKIRFDKNFHFVLNVSDTMKQKWLPPMALQIVIENAIKHNEVSNDLPLTVEVKTIDNYLSITNNLQLRSLPDNGTNIGIKNIQTRYAYFTESPVIIKIDEAQYNIQLPLLSKA